MLRFTVLLLQATSAVLATATPRGGHHGGNSPWVPRFKNLVAFGDSYTDESRLGYFFEHNGTAPPPGLLLPFAPVTPGGGITWARRVAEYTSATLYDYAVSGAVCDNKIISRWLAGTSQMFPDVVYEVDAFIADTKYINASTKTNTLYTDRKPDNTVYSMWIGTNDLGNGAFLTDSSLKETSIPDYVDCIFDRFDSIYKAGGRYFVLMNNAPLQLAPLYGMPPTGLTESHYWTDKPANITEVSGKMKQYTKLANSIFDYRTPYELLVAKRYPGASFAIFDVNSLMTDIYNKPSEYLQAPANVTHAYSFCDITGANCVTEPGTELNQFMWFDELHPSAKVDEVIGQEFVKIVKGTSDYTTYWP
ncbi:Carbohydrate esterase family 16 protein [Venustampulla echinocandica]|uniref:Carbohydrate esterase family 16 protein n=1 Tax=Venustampulla echinocandica TaxID=2656787 RepID=A0A370TC07_9HELO|nr:Carbohydrate esterase family 16 protein [Venustampulla echinocandica]RDL31766.1 Carbohydrate esterase family 16 protein [Venustampulla echinocandica]